MNTRNTLSFEYHPQSVVTAFRRLLHGVDPWIAVGDFLDDWRRTPAAERPSLVEHPIATVRTHPELHRWAVFFAAMVEQLCAEAGLHSPAWTARSEYMLSTPWYQYPGTHPDLRAWQETASPEPFRRRNIFGGDQILTRV